MDYPLLEKQARSLLETESHPLPALANISALIYETVEGLNWAGFYLMEGGSLMLGPFQGRTACIRISLDRGVCGAAAREDKVLVVADVHDFPGHIACDSRSRSELVIPIHHGGRVIGVLDMDSPEAGRFTEEDKNGLLPVVHTLEECAAWGRWSL